MVLSLTVERVDSHQQGRRKKLLGSLLQGLALCTVCSTAPPQALQLAWHT